MRKYLITKSKSDLKSYYKALWDASTCLEERTKVKRDFYSDENKKFFPEHALDAVWEEITREFQRQAVKRLDGFFQ